VRTGSQAAVCLFLAAEQLFSSVIGSRREKEFNTDAFPRSTYLLKSMTIRVLLFTGVAEKLGHDIITWYEEAQVHPAPAAYFYRRLDLKPSGRMSVFVFFLLIFL